MVVSSILGLSDKIKTILRFNFNLDKSLQNFSPSMPDGFFWEYNARAIYNGYKIIEIGINHKKRKYGNTQIFHFWK